MHQTYSPHITTTMNNPQFPEHEHLNCPRCDSSNTKFCYYNNYNLSQPRHFCKNCRRYWTKGGTLRNIPVGGGTRKTTAKRASSSSKRPADSDSPATPSPPPPRDESKAEEMETETESSDLMKLDGENFESMLKSNQRVEFGPNLSNSPVTTPSPPEILGYRSDRMKLDGESFELTLKSNQRLQLGGFLDGLRPNLSAAESPAKTTPSPPPPRAESEAETLGILGYRSDQMKLDGESFKSMLKSNQRLQLGSFMDGLRPNLSGGADSISPVTTTPSPPPPPPRAESKAEMETETLGILGYRSNRTKLDGESFESERTPANTGGSRRQYLSLNGDDNESGGGNGGGGRDGGNRWPNLSIFTPDSNLH